MATDSIREKIMEQVKTTLAGIAAGATYFTTFKLVERVHQNPLTTETYPQLSIVEGDEQDEVLGIGVGLTGRATRVLLPIELWFADLDKTDRSLKGNRILHDLHLAALTLDNTTVAGTRVSVTATGATLPLTEVEAPLVVGALYCALQFIHRFGDPTLPG